MGYPQDPRYGQQERPAFEPPAAQDAYGRQPYDSGPQYGYGPPGPRPPSRNHRTALIVALAVGVPMLLLAGFATAWLVLVVPARTAAPADPARPAQSGEAAPDAPRSPSTGESAQADDGGQQQPDGSGKIRSKIGGTVTLEGNDPGAKMAVTLNRIFNEAESVYGRQPEAGNRFMAVELTMVNKGTAPYDDMPGIGSVVIDDTAKPYASRVVDVKQGKQWASTVTLSPGDSATGVLVFEVPADAKLVKFAFGLDGGHAEQHGEWALA